MHVPLSWLRDFLPVDRSVAELSDAFNELGLVVEGVEVTGEGLDGIVTALVRGIRKHPDADKIRLVDVVTAEEQTETLQVCCGAWNFSEGDRVPFATLGTTMPGGMKIEKRKLRGEWSNGMLCSARELELSEDHSGIMLLPADTPLGIPITEALGIRPDAVFDLSVEANRPDAMSIVGVARDLAAKLKVPFAGATSTVDVTSAPKATTPRGSITATDLCDRLTVTVIRNVRVTESPDWMQARLLAGGMRPINNLVDASNYVMLESGAPSHAFDLDKLAGGRIGVRWAAAGEKVATLDGTLRTLGEGGAQDGVIVDGADSAMGIAAIMGGAVSEVDETTTQILFEVAHWTPMCIARSSKRLGLRSEASARFERGTDPEGLVHAVNRFVEVLRLTCPDLVVESFDDIRPVQPTVRKVLVRSARVALVLGVEIPTDRIVALLEPIGFACAAAGDDVLEVTIPSWRPDATGEIDVIEEVGRHYGYDNIPRRTPSNDRVGSLTPYQRDRRRVATLLADVGADEVWTATLVAPADLGRSGLSESAVALTNPMAKEESVLRTALLPGLLRTLSHNANHRNPDLRLFELGHVFGVPAAGGALPDETEHVAVALAAEGDDARSAVHVWGRLLDALRIAPDTVAVVAAEHPGLHPTRSASLVAGGVVIGVIGEVDPEALAAWGIDRRVGFLDADLARLTGLPRRPIQITSFSRFPSSDLDLAFVAPDGVAASGLEAALRTGGGELLQSVRLFDVYRGNGVAAGTRSLAFRLRFAAADRTLADNELAAVRTACIDAVVAATGATLRA